MAAVAWARPYTIRHLTRAIGNANAEFTNMIRFYDVSKGNTPHDIEVTSSIRLSNSSGSAVYCRSHEVDETWPSIYEKAYAKWKTGISGDHPDITATAGGFPEIAAAELTGLKPFSYLTTKHSADELWDKVRENSASGRTVNPMVAYTYPSGDAAPNKVVYGDVNLVANHAYSVLGWDFRDGKRYIILRNPWGQTEATSNIALGNLHLWDISWTRHIALANNDGVFALNASTFKQYFAALGVVK